MICVRTNITNFVKICLEIKQLFYIKVIAKKPPKKQKSNQQCVFPVSTCSRDVGGRSTGDWSIQLV